MNALREHANWDDVVVHGACPTGADYIADVYWQEEGGLVDRWPADWLAYGRAAGPMRNMAMIDSGVDLVLAFIRNNSRGAEGCLRLAREADIPAVVYRREDR